METKFSLKGKWSIDSFLLSLQNRELLEEALQQCREELSGKQLLFLRPVTLSLKRKRVHEEFLKNIKPPSITILEYLQCILQTLKESDQFVEITNIFCKQVLLASRILQCFDAQISLTEFKSTIDAIVSQYEKSLIAPGEMVGVIAAQSISERFTQSTLNTFHLSGSQESAAQRGINRIVEILNVSKRIGMPYLRPVAALRGDKLIGRTLAVLSESYGIVYERNECGYCPWVIFFKLDSQFDYNTYIKPNLYRLPDKLHRTFLEDLGELRIYSHKDASLNDVKMLQSELSSLHFSGVKRATMYNAEDEVLYFEPGTNCLENFGPHFQLDDLLEASDYQVNLLTLQSNDSRFMLHLVGIEATRNYLLNEIKEVLSREGIRLNVRHIMLLVDYMTREGDVLPNHYHGMGVEAPILKATFQQATDSFALAAANGVTDNIEDVSSQIMLGLTPNIGTRRSHVIAQPFEPIKEREKKLDLRPQPLPLLLSNTKYNTDSGHANVGYFSYKEHEYVPASPALESMTMGEEEEEEDDDDFIMPSLTC